MSSRLYSHPAYQEFLDWVHKNCQPGLIDPASDVKPFMLDANVLQAYFKANDHYRLNKLLRIAFPVGDIWISPEEVADNWAQVFCTLLLIGRPEYIHRFVACEHLQDLYLPFDDQYLLRHFATWIDQDQHEFLRRFCREQWVVCAPKIDFREHRIFEDGQILPFKLIKRLGGGVSAHLYEIEIWPTYNQLNSSNGAQQSLNHRITNTYMLKTYCGKDAERNYKAETGAFRLLRTKTQSMIGFYGGFRHGDRYNIILEFADKGTLEDYFKTITPPITREEIITFWEHLFQLIEALLFVHGGEIVLDPDGSSKPLHGWHQDVKPSNILVTSLGDNTKSPYEWHFKLADLGVSHFKISDQSAEDATDRDSQRTRTYGAPECCRSDETLGKSKLQVTQTVDIWSLGAVFSVAAVWLVEGNQSLKEYRRDRQRAANRFPEVRGTDCFHDGQKMLDTVAIWHERLKKGLRRDDVITEPVLELIECMLHDETSRVKAPFFWKWSRRILEKAKGNLKEGNVGSDPNTPMKPRPPTSPSVFDSTSSAPPRPDLPAENVGQFGDFPRISSPPALYETNNFDQGEMGGLGRFVSQRKTSAQVTTRYPQSSRQIHRPSVKFQDATNLSFSPNMGPRARSHDVGSAEPMHQVTQSQVATARNVDSMPTGTSGQFAESLYRTQRGETSPPQPGRYPPPETTPPIREAGPVVRQKPKNKPPAVLSVATAISVLAKGEAEALPGYKVLFPRLKQRNHLFIIDDALSMLPHWHDVEAVFWVMAKIVKAADPNGINLHFTMTEEVYNSRNIIGINSSSKLVGHVQQRRSKIEGTVNITYRLDAILGPYTSKLSNAFSRGGGYVRPLNIYVLTDGVWEPGCDASSAIKNLVDKLTAFGYTKDSKQVGIQFISFGKNGVGLKRLNDLEDNLGQAMDIVDTTASDGNVWKMLLGSIDQSFDDQQFATDLSSYINQEKEYARSVGNTAEDSGYHSRNTIALDELRINTEPSDEDGKEISDDDSDANTVLTDGNDLPNQPNLYQRLISVISNTLFAALKLNLDMQPRADTIRIHFLSEILKDFALKLEQTAMQGGQMDSVIFIRHNRKKIASSLKGSFISIGLNLPDHDSDDESEDDLPSGRQHGSSYYQGSVEDWIFGTVNSSPPDTAQTGLFDVEGSLEHQFSEMKSFILDSPAYKWLLEKLRSLLVLDIGDTFNSLRKEIRKLLEDNKGKRGYSKPTYRANFEVDCCPATFLNDQYSDELRTKLGEVLVLVGSEVDAQSIICHDYVSQTWPALGEELFRLLENMIEENLNELTQRFSDNTEVRIVISSSRVMVTASGSLPSVAEVGELLGWLGAILRTSGEEGVIAYSIPRIEKSITAAMTFNLSFEISPLNQIHTKNTQKGTCWHALFNNPVIAKGYPIPKRGSEKGLEIPLSYMAQLGQAYRATVFGGHLVIKGCITMFAPTLRLGNSVLWHFLFNRDERRMSYLTPEDLGLDNVSSEVVDHACLDSVRNFLGWSSHIEIHTGTATGLYRNIRRAHVDKVSSGIAIGNFSVTAGKLVNIGIALKKGTKDSPTVLQRKYPYDRTMAIASKDMHVVLFDKSARRGYLLDAARVLLHITCCELSSERYYPDLNFEGKFEHATSDPGARAALEALKKSSNKQLEISEDVEHSRVTELEPSGTVPYTSREFKSRRETKSKLWCFQEAALNVYDVLEQMYDHQTEIRNSQDIMIHLSEGKLEGYEVMDIVEGLKNSVPRVVQLKDSGRGWVKFVRRIGALTLFGNDFGNLITPAKGSNILCKEWEMAPSNHDLLLAPISVLQDIFDGSHKAELESLVVTGRMLLHTPEQLFANCKMDQACSKRCCKRLQTATSRLRKSPPNLKMNEYLFKQKDGAVIFGKGNLDLAGSSQGTGTIHGGPSQELTVKVPNVASESQQDSTLLSSDDGNPETSLSSPPSLGVQRSPGSDIGTPSTSLRIPSQDGTVRTETPIEVSVPEQPTDQDTEEPTSEAQQPSGKAPKHERLDPSRLRASDRAKKRMPRLLQRLFRAKKRIGTESHK